MEDCFSPNSRPKSLLQTSSSAPDADQSQIIGGDADVYWGRWRYTVYWGGYFFVVTLEVG